MKNRTWYCYALDIFGLIALSSAAIALFSAIWFAASSVEPQLLAVFRYSLMSALAAFLTARIFEISKVLRAPSAATQQETPALPANVEVLPERKTFSRAA